MSPKDKVALSTWFSYHNYGTALQVTALYHVLSRLGKEVDVVNYVPVGNCVKRPVYKGSASVYGELCNKALNKLQSRVYAPDSREKLFDEFLDEQLTFTTKCITLSDFEKLNDDYSTFVCGSDQIWNPTGHDPRYFFDYVSKNRLKVAYAPSVGCPRIEDGDVARRMKKLCGRFDALSTREESGSKIVSELTGRDVEICLHICWDITKTIGKGSTSWLLCSTCRCALFLYLRETLKEKAVLRTPLAPQSSFR